ncbi:MAG: esterase/lipase family protein [Granulosicoccus sp.]
MNAPFIRSDASGENMTILVHGLWMHGIMMSVLGRFLEQRGFKTHSVTYDFLNQTPAANARVLWREIQALGARRINLVGHSLGGIVILHFLQQFPQAPVGSVVLIGSPVKGSYVAGRLHRYKLFRGFLGRSVEQGLLGGVPDYEGTWPLGIITGSGGISVSSLFLPANERSDGVVREQETIIDKATERIIVKKSHSAMVFSRQCASLTANFLRYGRFNI